MDDDSLEMMEIRANRLPFVGLPEWTRTSDSPEIKALQRVLGHTCCLLSSQEVGLACSFLKEWEDRLALDAMLIEQLKVLHAACTNPLLKVLRKEELDQRAKHLLEARSSIFGLRLALHEGLCITEKVFVN